MRNYLVFEEEAYIPFQYPESREVEVGTEFVLDLSMDKRNTQTKTIKVRIIKIQKQEHENRILYHAEII